MRFLAVSIVAVLAACGQDFDPYVVNSAPIVRIDSPPDGTEYEPRSTIDFVGAVLDDNGLEDVVELSWTSDVDGLLGTPELTAPDAQGTTRLGTSLTSGTHTITLSARDAGDLVSSDSVTVVIGGDPTSPTAEVLSPSSFDEFEVGVDIHLVGVVASPVQPANTLWTEWTYKLAGGAETVIQAQVAGTGGTTLALWAGALPGNYEITLYATDAANLTALDSIFVAVTDPNGFDLDGDGFSPNEGDCDDGDPFTYPGAPERCDLVDNDCNLVIDDKDRDLDRHVDEACTGYDGAMLPIDDCDDNDGAVYTGAPETADGKDNDCDGDTDEDTPSFDDDGDCYCEVAPCTGSVDARCTTVVGGDCADNDDATHPNAPDVPDAAYWDDDCDGIDGHGATAVFVSVGGLNNSGCTKASPCATIGYAMQIAQGKGYHHVYVQAGSYAGVLEPLTGMEVYGGYALSSWARGPYTSSANRVRLTGGVFTDGEALGVRARFADVLFADLQIEAPSATGRVGKNGRSSYGVHAYNSEIVLERVKVVGGAGYDGLAGSGGGNASQTAAPRGYNGDPGKVLGSFIDCDSGRQNGGSAGTNSCSGGASTAGGGGGQGGQADSSCCWAGCGVFCGSCSDTNGLGGASASVSGTGYGGGGSGGGTCSTGSGGAGTPGRVVNGGSGGAASRGGSLVGDYWYGGTGGDGTLGEHGGGGGGGGGAGGCDNGSLDSDSRGPGGGGGGAGGCRASSIGTGGGSGGSSFAIFARESVIDLSDCEIVLGSGGHGGAGGNGGAGQPGGVAGSGGTPVSGTGSGGGGGVGGHGGHAGAGGGGAGGSTYGVFGYNSVVIPANPATLNSFTPGLPGNGGAGGAMGPGTTYSDLVNGGTGPNGVTAASGTCASPSGC